MAREEKTTIGKISQRNALLNYFQESFQELRKVTWPTRNQALRLTLLVLGFCLVMSIFIGALDFVLSFGHKYLLELVPPAATTIEDTSTSSSQESQPVATDAVITDDQGNEIPVKIETVPADSSGTPETTP